MKWSSDCSLKTTSRRDCQPGSSRGVLAGFFWAPSQPQPRHLRVLTQAFGSHPFLDELPAVIVSDPREARDIRTENVPARQEPDTTNRNYRTAAFTEEAQRLPFLLGGTTKSLKTPRWSKEGTPGHPSLLYCLYHVPLDAIQSFHLITCYERDDGKRPAQNGSIFTSS